MVELDQNPGYSARPAVVIWRSRPVAKSAYSHRNASNRPIMSHYFYILIICSLYIQVIIPSYYKLNGKIIALLAKKYFHDVHSYWGIESYCDSPMSWEIYDNMTITRSWKILLSFTQILFKIHTFLQILFSLWTNLKLLHNIIKILQIIFNQFHV